MPSLKNALCLLVLLCPPTLGWTLDLSLAAVHTAAVCAGLESLHAPESPPAAALTDTL